MLKIRITGSENELRLIAHKVGTTKIKRFKHKNGKSTYAIDVQISVNDFLGNLDLSEKNNKETGPEILIKDCDTREIQVELEALLKDMEDD
jgi:hypothetical protein